MGPPCTRRLTMFHTILRRAAGVIARKPLFDTDFRAFSWIIGIIHETVLPMLSSVTNRTARRWCPCSVNLGSGYASWRIYRSSLTLVGALVATPSV
jgi:hypothetical protein